MDDSFCDNYKYGLPDKCAVTLTLDYKDGDDRFVSSKQVTLGMIYRAKHNLLSEVLEMAENDIVKHVVENKSKVLPLP